MAAGTVFLHRKIRVSMNYEIFGVLLWWKSISQGAPLLLPFAGHFERDRSFHCQSQQIMMNRLFEVDGVNYQGKPPNTLGFLRWFSWCPFCRTGIGLYRCWWVRATVAGVSFCRSGALGEEGRVSRRPGFLNPAICGNRVRPYQDRSLSFKVRLQLLIAE